MPNKKAQNNTLNLRKTTLYSFFKQGLLVLFTSLTMMLLGCEDNSTEPKSTEKEITSFKFEATKNTALAADVDGTISGTAISVTLPAGTDVSALAPTIGSKGAKISPGNSVVQDFTSPVTYTVTAEDGTTVAYTVTVTAPTPTTSSSKDITMFGFKATPNNALSADVDGTISGTAITLTVPAGTNVTALIPEIAHSGMSIAPQSGVAQNFSQPINYTVTAQDNSTQQYVVTVMEEGGTNNVIAVVAYTGSTNLGPAIIDSLFEDTDRIATVSGIPQNAAAQILIKTGSGSSVITTTLDVTAANNEAAIPKSELNALITASTNSLSLRISVTQGTFMSNEVTLTYTHNALYTWQDVQAMRQRLTEDYTLMNNIDFPNKGVDGFPAEGFEPIGQFVDANSDRINDSDASLFQGSFDGGGHTISNFSSIRPTLDYVGLFGFAQSPAMATSSKIIQDVVIIQSGIEGLITGTLAGQLINVIVTDVGAESTASTNLVKGRTAVGGLVGGIRGAQVNGYAKVNIGQQVPVGTQYNAGGLIGFIANQPTRVAVVNGYATGDINALTAAASGSYLVAIGGLVGRILVNDTNEDPTTVTGYATGNISAHSGGSNSLSGPQFGIGGLIGATSSSRYTIKGYARGTITKRGGENTAVGLLVGNVIAATNSTISGYRSGKTGESTRTGLTTPATTVNDGTEITVTAATTVSNFSRLTFGLTVGQWTFTTGEWPAINLSTTATGAFSTTGQPTTR